MHHPELFAVPLLMLADYFLTIWGAKLSREVHAKHFVMPTYELNPIFRESVDKIRWFNLRHFSSVLLVTGALLAFAYATSGAESEDRPFVFGTFELLLGTLFGLYGCICGRHLTNVLMFRYMIRHPEAVSGEVRLSLLYILKVSQLTYLGLLPLFVLLAILEPEFYVLGAALGVFMLVLTHSAWISRAKHAKKPAEAEMAQE